MFKTKGERMAEQRVSAGIAYTLTRRRVRHTEKIAVRDMRTRWGSCSLKTGTLAFARRLCVMPPAAQEYVVVHEFCHFAHPDHSPAFWAAVAQVLPDYKQRQRLLKMG